MYIGDCQPRTVFCEESGNICRFPMSGSLLANSMIYQAMQVLPEEMYCVKDLLVDYSVFP